jgi:hypothetical protein
MNPPANVNFFSGSSMYDRANDGIGTTGDVPETVGEGTTR